MSATVRLSPRKIGLLASTGVPPLQCKPNAAQLQTNCRETENGRKPLPGGVSARGDPGVYTGFMVRWGVGRAHLYTVHRCAAGGGQQAACWAWHGKRISIGHQKRALAICDDLFSGGAVPWRACATFAVFDCRRCSTITSWKTCTYVIRAQEQFEGRPPNTLAVLAGLHQNDRSWPSGAKYARWRSGATYGLHRWVVAFWSTPPGRGGAKNCIQRHNQAPKWELKFLRTPAK
jgi:hypothetical protein